MSPVFQFFCFKKRKTLNTHSFTHFISSFNEDVLREVCFLMKERWACVLVCLSVCLSCQFKNWSLNLFNPINGSVSRTQNGEVPERLNSTSTFVFHWGQRSQIHPSHVIVCYVRSKNRLGVSSQMDEGVILVSQSWWDRQWSICDVHHCFKMSGRHFKKLVRTR